SSRVEPITRTAEIAEVIAAGRNRRPMVQLARSAGPPLTSGPMDAGPSPARRDGADAPLVLVVEDDPETRHFYVDALTHHGFRTDDAHNGFQALDKAFALTPDLVLADIAVPGIDG